MTAFGKILRPGLLATLASAVLLGGCWPLRFVDVPGVSGRLLDAETRTPIAAASINLVFQLPAQAKSRLAISDEAGRFELAAESSWRMYMPGAELWDLGGTVEISADGYKFKRVDVHWPVHGNGRKDLGTIELSRAPVL